MSSLGYSSENCIRIVNILNDTLHSGKEYYSVKSSISPEYLSQLNFSCQMEGDAESSDRYSYPMVWIGIYIAVASFFCILAMAADLLHGFRNKKFWFPCKYFSLNAASITVITIAMKLPVDLSSSMPGYSDQAAKVGSLGFMCTIMANLMPSLASMDNRTLLANVIGLCILVITIIVNICIQINTGVIHNNFCADGYYVDHVQYVPFVFTIVACINTGMMLLLLIIMISSSLTIPTTREILESKYRATNKMSLSDQRLQHIQMSRVEKLRQHVRRYWVMAETGSPQFGMASDPLSAASGVICVMVLGTNLLMGFDTLFRFSGIKYLQSDFKNLGGSPYKWSTTTIYMTQSIGVVVGTIAPISRCFSIFSFKLGIKWNENYFVFFKVEKYWIQKLHEWKQSPVLFLSTSRRSRSLIYNSKNIILSACIGLQKVIVISCKVIWLIMIIVTLFVVSCFYRWKSLKTRWFTPPIASKVKDIDENLNSYVLQIDNKIELDEKALKGISKSMNSFILKAEKEQNNNLLKLLEKSTGFDGVAIFDTDSVQPLLHVELVNSWSLPIVNLTCIIVALPNICNDTSESLLRTVGEGLSFTYLMEESLNSANGYLNIWKTTMVLWHEVETKWKWLDNPLTKNVFKGKTATEIVKWFSEKAKQIVTEIKESNDGELEENPSHTLIVANSMYRITQTILLRDQSNIEPITKMQLFGHLKGKLLK